MFRIFSGLLDGKLPGSASSVSILSAELVSGTSLNDWKQWFNTFDATPGIDSCALTLICNRMLPHFRFVRYIGLLFWAQCFDVRCIWTVCSYNYHNGLFTWTITCFLRNRGKFLIVVEKCISFEFSPACRRLIYQWNITDFFEWLRSSYRCNGFLHIL